MKIANKFLHYYHRIIESKDKIHISPLIVTIIVVLGLAVILGANVMFPLTTKYLIGRNIGKLIIQADVLAQEKLGVPKTAQEQLIVKVKKNALKGRRSIASKEAVVRNKAAKYTDILKVKKRLSVTETRLKRKGSSHVSKVAELYTIQVVANDKLSQVFAFLRNDPFFEDVQWNYQYQADMTPNDPQYSQQWSHPKTQAPQAWDLSTGGTNVIVAVIGTGVKWDHEDLAANIWANSDEISSNGIDDDSNGYIDDTRGWNFEFNNNNPSDRSTHETSVAGVVAATANNGKGIAGVCWQCKIMPLRVTYSSDQVAEALYYAIDNGAKIVNMSFGNYDPGKYGPDTVVEQAVNYGVSNDVMMVATAGNQSVNTKRYPAALDNVIATSATDSDDNRAAFSNWGDWVSIAAPGASIYSTTPTGYGVVNGTSFAAPYVAGVAGLLFSRFPTLSVQDARIIYIENSCR